MFTETHTRPREELRLYRAVEHWASLAHQVSTLCSALKNSEVFTALWAGSAVNLTISWWQLVLPNHWQENDRILELEGILEIIWFNLTCLMDWGGWGPETCHLPKVTQLICCWIRALVGVLSSCCCSVAQSSPDLWDPMDGSTPGFPVHHQLPEFTQTHVHWVSDTIQPTHSLSLPSLPAFNLLQLLGLFQWADSSHQVAKILELQLQHQSFQWIFRTDFL